MPETIRVYHDYICPFCYIGHHTAHRLEREFGVQFEWTGWQIAPDLPEEGKPREKREPSFMIRTLAYDQNLRFETPSFSANTLKALQGAEYAKEREKFGEYNDAVYRAYWVEGKNISTIEVLKGIAENIGLDGVDFQASLEKNLYADRVMNDDAADRLDIQRVPTFVFGGNRVVGYVPYPVLREVVKVHLQGYNPTI